MTPSSTIRYIERAGIDNSRWDRCIAESANALIYARSFYLDHMAANWDALVLDDYEAVMPLTWNKKYGVQYLYQPFLAANLGVFGKHVDGTILGKFLKNIPARFRYWDIYLNHGNLFPVTGYPLYQRINHVLNLDRPLEDIYKNYRSSYKQLLTRSIQLNCVVRKDIAFNDVLALAREKLDPIFRIDHSAYERFSRLYEDLQQKGIATNYGIYGPAGDLLASGIFLIDGARAYYILAGNHPNGRTLGASHQVIHSFVKEHAGQPLLLDFEGSDVERIAFFFKGFGAIEEKYPGLLVNNLPPLLRWLKRKPV